VAAISETAMADAAVDGAATEPAEAAPVGKVADCKTRGPRPALARLLPRADTGMTTAEYAVGTLAACGFAGLLLKVLSSGGMAALLQHVIQRALAVAG